MPLIHDDIGEILGDAQVQEMIRKTIERTGRFLLDCAVEPRVGEVREFGGLPLRMVRFVTAEDYHRDSLLCEDIWGLAENTGPFYFEVVVAD